MRRFVLFGIAAIIYAAIRADLLFSRMGYVLQADNPDFEATEYGVLLLGEFIGRSEAATSAWRAGHVRKIIWASSLATKYELLGYMHNEADYVSEFFARNGVPSSAWVRIDSCQTESTRDEAQCVLDWFRAHPPVPTRLTIVTSWYHTRRARWIFQKVWQEFDTRFQLIGYDDPDEPADQWWRFENSAFLVLQEFIKWGYYLGHY